jgi:hypothetical protein
MRTGVNTLRIALGIMLVAVAVNAQAATYYVDQTAGNDGNNGTSAGSAWKNAPGMAAYSGSGVLLGRAIPSTSTGQIRGRSLEPRALISLAA